MSIDFKKELDLLAEYHDVKTDKDKAYILSKYLKHLISDLEFEYNYKEVIDFIEEVLTYLKPYPTLLEEVQRAIYNYRDILISREVCPLCGSSLEQRRDKRLDQYAPYGDTAGIESYGYYLRCADCNFNTKEIL